MHRCLKTKMEVMWKVTDWTVLTIHLSYSFGQMVQSQTDTHTHKTKTPTNGQTGTDRETDTQIHI